MTTDSNPEPEGADAGHERTGQHGPEMDDTQVEATGELRDELPPVTDDSSADSSADAAG